MSLKSNLLEGFAEPIHLFVFLAYYWAEDSSSERKVNQKGANFFTEVFQAINFYGSRKDFQAETVRIYKKNLREKRILDLDLKDEPYFHLKAFVNEIDPNLIDEFSQLEVEAKKSILRLSDQFLDICEDILHNKLYAKLIQENGEFIILLLLKIFPSFNDWFSKSENLKHIMIKGVGGLLNEKIFKNLFDNENQEIFSNLLMDLLNYTNTDFYKFLTTNQLLGFPLLPAFNDYTMAVNKIKNGEEINGYVNIVPIFNDDIMNGMSIFSAFPLKYLKNLKDDEPSLKKIRDTFNFMFDKVFFRLLQGNFVVSYENLNIEPYLDFVQRNQLIKEGKYDQNPFLFRFIIDNENKLMGVNSILAYGFKNPIDLENIDYTKEKLNKQIEKFNTFIINFVPGFFGNINPDRKQNIKITIEKENEEQISFDFEL